MKIKFAILLLLFARHPLMAQQTDAASSARDESTPERANLYYQATSIGQYHGTFNSPYRGPFSFQNYPERDVSLTTTLFIGLRPSNHAQLYFDPEIAGGKGLSGVNGIANAPNGEMPRVATATPKPYLARLYLSYDFGFRSEKEPVDSDENHLAGERPMKRYTITVGRFSITDFFDNNRYTHDPRTQFMAWGVMYNGAWDYPADTRGYTWGMVHEFHTRNWSVRYGSAAEPKQANGPRFDRRIFRDRGDVVEGERRYSGAHPGAIRLLGYINHADSGDYGEARALSSQSGTPPDITAVRHPGTRKYGAGLNVEQEVTHDIGLFARLGWNDGKTQDFAFTAIDRLVSGGIAVQGTRWKRNEDVAGTSLTASALSGVHANYLAHGGLDFNMGDGRLNYSHEFVWETYYSARILSGFFATYDVQHVANPAYNRDRGPVLIQGLRLHLEFAVKGER